MLLAAAALFPVLGSIAGFLSGWPSIAKHYPDSDDPVIAKFNLGMAQVGSLTLRCPMSVSACRSGLRVTIWRGFFPLGHPFLVPWNEIRAQQKIAGAWDFYDTARLNFGRPTVGRMVLPADIWERLAKAAGLEQTWGGDAS